MAHTNQAKSKNNLAVFFNAQKSRPWVVRPLVNMIYKGKLTNRNLTRTTHKCTFVKGKPRKKPNE